MTSLSSTLRQPSALLPVLLSLVALALVLVHIAFFGVTRQADEDAFAHIWQLLMGIQVPIIAFFAIKYVPQRPREALLVLALQFTAASLACAPVYFLKM